MIIGMCFFLVGSDKMERINKYLDHVEDLVESSKDRELKRYYLGFVESPTLGNFRRVVGRVDVIFRESRVDDFMSTHELKQVEDYLDSVGDYVERYGGGCYADAYDEFCNSPTLGNLGGLTDGIVKYGFFDKFRGKDRGGTKPKSGDNEQYLMTEIDNKLISIVRVYHEAVSIIDEVKPINIGGNPVIMVDTPSQILVQPAHDLIDTMYNIINDAGEYLKLESLGPATGYDHEVYKINRDYVNTQPVDERGVRLQSMLSDINSIMGSPMYKTFSGDDVMWKIIDEYKYFIQDFKQYMIPDDASRSQDVMKELKSGVGYVYTKSAYNLFVNTIKNNEDDLLRKIIGGTETISSSEILEYLKMDWHLR